MKRNDAVVDLQTRLALLPPEDTQRTAATVSCAGFYRREAFALISEKVETQLANGHIF